MSVPSKNTVWGYLEYEGREFGILQTQFSDDLREKMDRVNRELQLLPYTSAPWRYKHYWSIENGRLYLNRLYSDEFHSAVFGSGERILADWVDEMKLLREHKFICRTYQQRGSYLNEMKTTILRFEQGTLIDEKRETKLYISIEMKRYIDAIKRYAFIQIDTIDLLNYLMNENPPKEDLNYSLISDFIITITDKSGQDDIRVDMDDIYTILKRGDIARFASAKGADIEEMAESLIASVTDEILQPKGTILHITANSEYPQEKISYIYNLFEKKVCSDTSDIILLGTKFDKHIKDNEVFIRVITAI